jgi:hypothetical protein
MNAGTITGTASSDATTQFSIIAGYGQTTLGFYTIPAGFTGYMTNWFVDFYQTTNTNTALIGLYTRCDLDGSTPSLNIKDIVRLVIGGDTTKVREYKPYLPIPAYSDVFIRIIDVSANNSEFSGGFDIILVGE